jgi:hypothetical protein
MTEYVPSLMNSIRMIHTISQYYNTSERMTSLFVKVTNQMISTCKAYINKGVSRIWDLPRYTRNIVTLYIVTCTVTTDQRSDPCINGSLIVIYVFLEKHCRQDYKKRWNLMKFIRQLFIGRKINWRKLRANDNLNSGTIIVQGAPLSRGAPLFHVSGWWVPQVVRRCTTVLIDSQ